MYLSLCMHLQPLCLDVFCSWPSAAPPAMHSVLPDLHILNPRTLFLSLLTSQRGLRLSSAVAAAAARAQEKAGRPVATVTSTCMQTRVAGPPPRCRPKVTGTGHAQPGRLRARRWGP